jgi:hypothetical protein
LRRQERVHNSSTASNWFDGRPPAGAALEDTLMVLDLTREQRFCAPQRRQRRCEADDETTPFGDANGRRIPQGHPEKRSWPGHGWAADVRLRHQP